MALRKETLKAMKLRMREAVKSTRPDPMLSFLDAYVEEAIEIMASAEYTLSEFVALQAKRHVDAS